VICTDKTGTLTTGVMSATTIAVASGDLLSPFRASGALDVEAVAALETAAICNDAGFDAQGRAVGSPTEAALLTAARAAGVDAARAALRVREIPFSSTRKLMTVVVERSGRLEAHVKGAPEGLVVRCASVLGVGGATVLGEAERADWLARASRMAESGLRVVAVARRVVAADDPLEVIEADLELLGLVGMKDPLRPGAREAVETARLAGARVIMITGDALETAAAVAEDVGLDHDSVLTAAELDGLDDRALEERLKTAVVLSRATPEHKLRIVERLQAAGEVVAMTGDGVNDAPALKKADIGIAMGVRGTDAAKAAADIVLLDDDFSTIVGAMREGRRQGDNIRKFIVFLLTGNVSEVIAVLVNVLIGAPLLVRPAQLLWINLVTDGATALALGLEKEEPDAMMRPPRRLGAAILDRPAVMVSLGLGLALAAATLWFFHGAVGRGIPAAQTMAFTALALFPQFMVLSFRSLRSPALRIGLFGNPAVLLSSAAGIGLQAAAVQMWPLNAALGATPLSLGAWASIAATGLAFLAAFELGKVTIGALERWRRRRT
jgi:Ca2+-transporting ATPase